MQYKGSIKNRLVGIILTVSILTSFISYSSFVYWYIDNQNTKSLNLSKTIGHILGQDIAKLTLLKDMTAAADMSTKLKSFPELNTMVLYNIDGKAIFQYSKRDESFQVDALPNIENREPVIDGNILKLYEEASYYDTKMGLVELNLEIHTLADIIKQNIFILISILFIMLVLSYFLAIFYAKKFTNPIVNLVKSLEDIGISDSLNIKINTEENNEYGKLYEEINIMLQRIEKNQESLKIAAVSFETQMGMSITNADNKIIKINKAFTDITGYEESDVIGKTPSVLNSGIHNKEFYIEMYDLLAKNRYWTGEISNRHKNGTIVKEQLTINTVHNSDGEVLYYIASFIDITLLKNTQQDLKHQKEYLNTVVETNNHAIIAIDDKKIIRTYNKRAEELFGFTKEEMIGKDNLLNIIPLKYKNLHTVASSLFFKTGKSKGLIGETLELEGLRKNGETFPIRISFGIADNDKNNLVVANMLDITDELHQDKIIKQQSKLAQMGEMISMIAHQWRQPLSAIGSTSSAINLKAKLNKLDKDTAIELSSNISEYSQHLSSTIDDFREFFKVDKEKETISYNQLIQSVLNIVETSIVNKNIKLVKELNCEDTFTTYTNEIKQVILNILKNAEDILLENNIENPVIKIETQCGVLTISDNGGGIPEDIIDKIFDPYFSTKLEKNGTGLGLYMSKTIIEEHCNGELTASNDKDGAVFKIVLGINN